MILLKRILRQNILNIEINYREKIVCNTPKLEQ